MDSAMDGDLLPAGETLLRLHDEAVARWHEPGAHDRAWPAEEGGMAVADRLRAMIAMIREQHQANFDLWHQEDEARDPEASDTRIAEVKRAIDRLNQRRNDLVEAIDGVLHERLDQSEAAPLHSETPGMIVDRLSIMSLKVYHTREEMVRVGSTDAHRQRNHERLQVLEAQRRDLATCLEILLEEIGLGRRRFKLYRQMKMYNDPELNPALYRHGGG